MARKKYIIPAIGALCVFILLLYGPVPQDPAYHRFADNRTIFGILNFWNVITNLPFAFTGMLGLGEIKHMHIRDKGLRHILFVLFAGFILLLFGSGYYHLWPRNETLVYDRLPMALIFMSFLSFFIHDRIRNPALGYASFLLLNITGVLTVVYWILTEQAGKGDLRWYGMVQFFPLLALPLLLKLYPEPFAPWKEVALLYLFFFLAKLCESFDEALYRLLGGAISGHSLKHLLMAAAGYVIVVLVRHRMGRHAS